MQWCSKNCFTCEKVEKCANNVFNIYVSFKGGVVALKSNRSNKLP